MTVAYRILDALNVDPDERKGNVMSVMIGIDPIMAALSVAAVGS